MRHLFLVLIMAATTGCPPQPSPRRTRPEPTSAAPAEPTEAEKLAIADKAREAAAKDELYKLVVSHDFCDQVRAGRFGTNRAPMDMLATEIGMPDTMREMKYACLRDRVSLDDIPRLMAMAKMYYVANWNLGTYYDRDLRHSTGISYDAGCFPVVETFEVKTNGEAPTVTVGRAIRPLTESVRQIPCPDGSASDASCPKHEVLTGFVWEYIPLVETPVEDDPRTLATTDQDATLFCQQAKGYGEPCRDVCKDEGMAALRRLARR